MCKKFIFSWVLIIGLFFGAVNDASAQVTPASSTFEQIFAVLDPVSMAYAIGTLGGAALVAAFSVGGGFVIAKKAFNWTMRKL